MILRLSSINIILPNEYDVEQRKELVNSILGEYPHEFEYKDDMFDKKYGSVVDNNKITKIRLDILATYLIRADEKYTKNVMSRYKEKKRPLQEISFSQFKESVRDTKGWY